MGGAVGAVGGMGF